LEEITVSERTPRILAGGREWLTAFVQDFGSVLGWSRDQVEIFADSTKAAAQSTAKLTRRWSRRVIVGPQTEDQRLRRKR
jgi:hypothetical protein